MGSNILIKCHKKNESYILKKIIKNDINIINSKYTKEYIYYLISENDYEKLLKIDYKRIIDIEKHTGIKEIKNAFVRNIEKILISLGIVILVFLSKLYIFKVNVYVNDLNLKKIITYTLMDEGIKDNSLVKSFNDINKIKNKILKKYNDEIEWLEISKNGYEYDVRIIKREKSVKKNESEKCNYVASKSGTIKTIMARKGVLLVQENNFVNKGDILISGDIVYNEELKTTVCAQGLITGEVWYKVNVSYPLKKIKYYKKKTRFYNMNFNFLNRKYKLFKDRYDNSRKIISIGSNNIGLVITNSFKKYKKVINYSEEEALKKSIDLAKKKVLLKANKNSHILSENILKKDIKNGKINVEVLITVEEELGVVENY